MLSARLSVCVCVYSIKQASLVAGAHSETAHQLLCSLLQHVSHLALPFLQELLLSLATKTKVQTLYEHSQNITSKYFSHAPRGVSTTYLQ